jgi:hypothetical protein
MEKPSTGDQHSGGTEEYQARTPASVLLSLSQLLPLIVGTINDLAVLFYVQYVDAAFLEGEGEE